MRRKIADEGMRGGSDDGEDSFKAQQPTFNA